MYDPDRTCPYTGDDCDIAARGLDPDYCVDCPVLMPPDDADADGTDDAIWSDQDNADDQPTDSRPFGPSIPDDELPF